LFISILKAKPAVIALVLLSEQEITNQIANINNKWYLMPNHEDHLSFSAVTIPTKMIVGSVVTNFARQRFDRCGN
jgi:hypothetical protein